MGTPDEEDNRPDALRDARRLLRERERAERELAEERERLRITLASIGDAVISTDAQGRVVFLNGAAESLTGWPQDQAAGKPLPDVFRAVHEETRRPVENPALRALAEGRVVGLANHTVLIGRDGAERPIDDTAAPMRDRAGATVGAVLVFRDVTERARAEEARARLAAIVESSDDAIVSKTLDGTIRTWNAGAQRLFGYTREEAVGRNITLIIPPDRHDEERDILERLRRGERVEHYETVRVGRDGRRVDVSLTVSPIKDREGRVIGASKIARDVTERRRGEAQARLALDVAQVGTWSWRPDSGEVVADARGREIVGLGADGPLTLPDVLPRVHPDDRPRVEAALRAALRAEGPGLYADEFRFVHADGAVRWVVARGQAFFNGPAGRRPTTVLGTVLDITDRKRAEETLREADRKKDDFIALLAHELRNPLAPIRSGLQVMRLAPGDAAAVAQARAIMDRQLTHMVRLIDDLLDLSGMSRNKLHLRRAPVLLSEVVSHAVEATRPAIEAAGHHLAVSLPPGPVLLDADLTRLAQVLGNLLSNSAKYTEPGGRVWLTAEVRGGEAVVSVRDTGIGIPADALLRVFDMFSQVDRPVERSNGGLGIGLALVKGLVEMHGGAVTAESPGPGAGSTFTVRLPILTGRTDPSAAATAGGRVGFRAGRRVLVVDDSRDGAESMATMLRLLGYEVDTAYDGVEAVEAAERVRPDLILMDVGMPRLNGLDATRQIRERPWGRGVVVVAVTGWGQEGDRERSRAAGCDAHLVKPVNLPDLEKLLAELAGRGGPAPG